MSIFTCQSLACTAAMKNAGRACVEPTETFTGAVLSTYERNGYDDSDFVAIVWSATTGELKHVTYASTRGWTYHNSASVDATPEVIALAEQALAATLTRMWVDDAAVKALEPTVGASVKSLTTRGVNKGIEGTIKWIGVDQFKSSRWSTVMRVGVKVAGEDKLRYLPMDRVALVSPVQVNEVAIATAARERAAQHGWRVSL